MDKPKIIYYYQTFTGLKNILAEKPYVTHIHLSSIHFGLDENNKPYIHLNDNNPQDKCFDSLWKELKEAQNLGIKIVLMIGGAGGAFNDLFSNFDIYYKLLTNTINSHSIFSGIDLDVEEYIDIEKIEFLINKLKMIIQNLQFVWLLFNLH